MTEPKKKSALEALGLGEEVSKLVDEAKSRGCLVAVKKLGEWYFVYRSLTRAEWKKLQQSAMAKVKKVSAALDKEGVEDIDPALAVRIKDEGEEEVIVEAMLYPKATPENLSKLPAGFVGRLADHITELSGFGDDESPPIRL